MGNLFSKEDIRRLEKAARDKNRQKLVEWMEQYENYLLNIMQKEYDKLYQDEVESTVQNALTAVAYTAYFSEESYIDKNNIADFMADLFSTLDMYRTGEYTPQEYKSILEKSGIYLDDYDYDGPYKKFLKDMDIELIRYLRGRHKKIVTICGSSKFKSDILSLSEDLTLQNYIVLKKDVYYDKDTKILQDEINQINDLQKEKILISDLVYVVNKDNYIDDVTKAEIEYAKAHNKNIIYTES